VTTRGNEYAIPNPRMKGDSIVVAAAVLGFLAWGLFQFVDRDSGPTVLPGTVVALDARSGTILWRTPTAMHSYVLHVGLTDTAVTVEGLTSGGADPGGQCGATRAWEVFDRQTGQQLHNEPGGSAFSTHFFDDGDQRRLEAGDSQLNVPAAGADHSYVLEHGSGGVVVRRESEQDAWEVELPLGSTAYIAATADVIFLALQGADGTRYRCD
jgi:hypothetical protein